MSRRGAPPPPLSRSTFVQLCRVVHARREGWLLADRLERAAQAAVGDARRERAAVMRLAVALRRAWADVPDLERVDAQGARDLLNHLVTACVHAYYGAQYDEGRDGGDGRVG